MYIKHPILPIFFSSPIFFYWVTSHRSRPAVSISVSTSSFSEAASSLSAATDMRTT